MSAPFHQAIRQFPRQFLESWKIVVDHPGLGMLGPDRFRRIYYGAMGGSSLPADILNDIYDGNPRLELLRDYDLPAGAGSEDLLIAASFSGNTEETLAVLAEALKRGLPSLALSNGGKLEQDAKAAGIPWIPIPHCIQPRCASGYFYATLLGLLYKMGRIDSPESELKRLEFFLEGFQDAAEARGKKLASALKDRVPLIYGPSRLEGVCRIWKIKLNENAKIQSFYNVLPELNHNEMVGFTRLLMKPVLVFLESRFMHPRIERRMEVMKELLAGEMPVLRVPAAGDTPLQEMFGCLLIADYASYYLAAEYGVDPAPVAMVEEFKRKL
ncbi:MAG TPA: bifunctional phosphoglucose/phosphomannose isomerase [bacterium]|nr:bifunctional phosphoglucose/phosphomannose isomerase [bacterium]